MQRTSATWRAACLCFISLPRCSTLGTWFHAQRACAVGSLKVHRSLTLHLFLHSPYLLHQQMKGLSPDWQNWPKKPVCPKPKRTVWAKKSCIWGQCMYRSSLCTIDATFRRFSTFCHLSSDGCWRMCLWELKQMLQGHAKLSANSLLM